MALRTLLFRGDTLLRAELEVGGRDTWVTREVTPSVVTPISHCHVQQDGLDLVSISQQVLYDNIGFRCGDDPSTPSQELTEVPNLLLRGPTEMHRNISLDPPGGGAINNC